MVIRWSDGHCGDYPWWYLRGFCPCAHCQGHGGGDWTFIESEESLALELVEAVGHYAVSLRWNNGHSTGIYSWETLRELCPCVECRESVGENHVSQVLPPGYGLG